MPPMYIVQQGAKVRLENHRLWVDLEGETLTNLPLGQVSQVVLFGNVGLTTPAIGALLAQNIEVVFLSEEGVFRGRLVGGVTPHVLLRRAQYRRTAEAEFCLVTARGLVAAKLVHLHTLLQRHNRELDDPQVAAAAAQVASGLESVPGVASINALLGIEGSATRAYFSGYRRFFGAEWRFSDRNRRPPADPVNVLLSLGYTLLGNVTDGAIQTTGLDPFAGFLHGVAYNRPGLALDLLEEFRPVVDGLVLWACHGGQITTSDFTPGPAERPVVLSEQGLRRYIQAFEKRLERRVTHPRSGQQASLRQCIFEQARQVAARIKEGEAGYQGMGWR